MKIKIAVIILLFLVSGMLTCVQPAPNLSLSYGAFLRPDGIEFRLLAPSSKRVQLVIFSSPADESGNEYPMDRSESGVWSYFLKDAGPGTLYGY
ncbi:MAG: hypothetical protein QF563_04340, partial [Candidatus Marinimicrobia bacterium]|nr:hypothetical protein [Candidatus Neomarinimicrobiota bacterium]